MSLFPYFSGTHYITMTRTDRCHVDTARDHYHYKEVTFSAELLSLDTQTHHSRGGGGGGGGVA